ncbi:MAG: DNA repair protein RecO [Acidimicrobiales bacterium]|nr:DNA repair protein RecO [Acidimicrobiales bacterium]MYH75856.1 DNA repair protein RecO [Acidimicrobiales bacterium]MYK71801.1 DNA repair protein RecO [Acidimicrobiales bacterium]
MQYRDRGVVLRTTKLGEADRIITIITSGHGKVRAVAKGARRTRSKLAGHVEPLRHVDLQLYRGRGELDIVTGAVTLDRWPALRSDLDRLGTAMTLAEAVDQSVHDRADDPVPYQMLIGALGRLDRAHSDMLLPAFLLRLLAHEGTAPMLDRCVVGTDCDDAPIVAFDPAAGGVTCATHRRGRQISLGALTMLRLIIDGRVNAVLDVEPSSDTHEAAAAVTRMWEYHMDRRLRSADLLG